MAVAHQYLTAFAAPGSELRPFTDAWTYLAAGERLNDGHPLYRLGLGDREVDGYPESFPTPLVSPPFIAVIWRPIAAINAGFGLWILRCWMSLLGTIAYLVLRIGPVALLVALLLAVPIGEQLAVANVSALFPAALVATWHLRGTLWAG